MALQQCAGLTLVLHHLHHKADVRKQPKLNCKDITVGTLQHFSYKYFVNSDILHKYFGQLPKYRAPLNKPEV